MKKALIYHTDINSSSSKADLDVLEQAKFVTNNLLYLGYKVEQLPFRYNPDFFSLIEQTREETKYHAPDFIFNLVESLDNRDELIYLPSKIFETLRIPYTGCPALAFAMSSDKIRAKKTMIANSLKTPYYLTGRNKNGKNRKFLLKSITEHSSFGLEEEKLELLDDIEKINKILSERKGFFAEEYIDGREFNISMIGGKISRVLPIAEMRFENYPQDKLKIIGENAKWNSGSFEDTHTIRSFDFPEEDKELLSELEKMCIKSWNVFNLNGYARIDFRVKENQPYILEINANPCLSPDAGFFAACKKADLSPSNVIEEIIRHLNYTRKFPSQYL